MGKTKGKIEKVEILDETDKALGGTCESCQIRQNAKAVAQRKGVDPAIQYRLSHCVSCIRNPGSAPARAIAKKAGVALASLGVGELDNWEPVAVPLEAIDVEKLV